MAGILVLERPSGDVLGMADILMVKAYAVAQAASPGDAVAEALETEPDLVVAEVAALDGEGGLGLVRRLCAVEGFRPVPVLFVADDEAEVAERLCGLPEDTLMTLVKPFDPEAFLEKVEWAACCGRGFDASRIQAGDGPGSQGKDADTDAESEPEDPGLALYTGSSERDLPDGPDYVVPRPGQAPTVLLVEDTYPLRRAMRKSIETAGCQVIEAEDGVQALNLIANNHVDLVLLDVMLPRLDGFNLLALLRADARFAKVPVIMCTAKNGKSDVLRGKRLQASGYIVKPFRHATLTAKITEALGQAPGL